MKEKIYRKIPGFGNKYCVNNQGKVYNTELKRHLVEQTANNGKKFYRLTLNGQLYKYSSNGLRSKAFADGMYKGKEKGEIVYIEMEESTC